MKTDRQTRSLTLAQTLKLAVDLLRDGRLEESRKVYEAVLERIPDQSDALHFLGLLRHRQGDSDSGLALLHRSIALMPDQAGPLNNLGNVLLETGRLEEALECYVKSVGLDGTVSEVFCNIAALHRRRGDLPAAHIACRQAVEVDPDDPRAWYNLSRILIEQGLVNEGLMANSKAIALWPTHLQERDQVVRALVMLGDIDRAVALYRDWLAEEPDNPIVRHHLAACLDEAPPPRASDAYVRLVFDRFADSFEEKLAKLEYRAPQLIADALRDRFGADDSRLRIADLGCGTGLLAPLIRARAAHLAGCDLSSGMLAKARQRGQYDSLHQEELTRFLGTHERAFDVLLSADTLCYFGDLTEVSNAAARALANGGYFVFTVEALAESGVETAGEFVLRTHGRYAHSHSHLERVLTTASFERRDIRKVVLRKEAGVDVAGWLVLAKARLNSVPPPPTNG